MIDSICASQHRQTSLDIEMRGETLVSSNPPEWRNRTWRRLEVLQKNDFSRVPSRSGTYIVRHAPKGQADMVLRAGGLDMSGTLYIGRSGNLKATIKTFYDAITDRHRPLNARHLAGERFLAFRYQRTFRIRWLDTTWHLTSQENLEAKKLLDEYHRQFLDMPPLN
jgi:hypothetical protein